LHSFGPLFGAAPAFRVLCRIHDYPDVVFDHLSHEAVEGPSRADHEVQYRGVPFLVLDRAFKRLDLATDTI
jgi:hypothetical protein